MRDKQEECPLWVEDLSVWYHTKSVLSRIDYQAPAQGLIAIIGPNGAGKTTFLKSLLELVPKQTGRVLIFGEPLGRQYHRIAYVPQRECVDWDFPISAVEVVTMGLYGKIGWFRRVGHSDRLKAYQALAEVGMEHCAQSQIGALSGGQQQRIFLARALVQEADLYLMDEPFAGIDAVTECAVADLLKTLQQRGKTVLCVHHNLQTARAYFDHGLILNRVKIAQGPLEEILTPEILHQAYWGETHHQ